jgi:hypothetical protein
MELVNFKHLTQDQLVRVINMATVYLDYEQYNQTHLYINGKNAEPVLWFDASK